MEKDEQSAPSKGNMARKLAFITIGATSSFHALLKASLSPSFLQALAAHNYTDMLLQYGADGHKLVLELLQQLPGAKPERFASSGNKAVDAAQPDAFLTAEGIRVTGFDFRREGLRNEMVAARGGQLPFEASGVCVSHAGSGTVLDALRVAVPLIVVPNPTLLHNHQVELAVELARQEYAVHAQLEVEDGLAHALDQAESIKAQRQITGKATVNSGEPPTVGLFQTYLEEEAGFLRSG